MEAIQISGSSHDFMTLLGSEKIVALTEEWSELAGDF